jgi:hypothetical protein
MDVNKKAIGQFFTVNNPFNHSLFSDWINTIDNFKDEIILEPFAGINSIVSMIHNIGIVNDWDCFDIDINCAIATKDNKYPVKTLDTLSNFPNSYNVAITNPPYLAKNSASRSGISFPDTKFNDLYQISLNQMLNNCKYVAAIIPESFLTQDIFHNRIYGIISLTMKMFNDTTCPVCLALFIPENKKNDINDFIIYSGNKNIGKYINIKKLIKNVNSSLKVFFNIPNGEIGLFAIDNTNHNSIQFVRGEIIDSSSIKHSSRSITRIHISDTNIDIDNIIYKCNIILKKEREATNDIFFTSFKGLRKDNRYRRRLDFKTAKRILKMAYEDIKHDYN